MSLSSPSKSRPFVRRGNVWRKKTEEREFLAKELFIEFCVILSLPKKERRVVLSLQFKPSKGLYGTEADAWLVSGEAKEWAWPELALTSEQGERAAEWIKWLVLMAGRGACSPRNISYLEDAKPDDLVPVHSGCMEGTKGAGMEGPVVSSQPEFASLTTEDGATGEPRWKGYFEKPPKVLRERKSQDFGTCHPEGPKAVLKYYLWKTFPQISSSFFHVTWEKAQNGSLNEQKAVKQGRGKKLTMTFFSFCGFSSSSRYYVRGWHRQELKFLGKDTGLCSWVLPAFDKAFISSVTVIHLMNFYWAQTIVVDIITIPAFIIWIEMYYNKKLLITLWG